MGAAGCPALAPTSDLECECLIASEPGILAWGGKALGMGRLAIEGSKGYCLELGFADA